MKGRENVTVPVKVYKEAQEIYMHRKPNFIAFGKLAIKLADTLAKRLVVFVYFRSRFVGGNAKLADIVNDFELLGLGKPRADRVRQILSKDRRVRRIAFDTWIVPADRFQDVEDQFGLVKFLLPNNLEKNVRVYKTKQFRRSGVSFIDKNRLSQLQKISSSEFDLSRLIRICVEIDANFGENNYISTILLIRSLLDHVAPIFGFNTFSEVANNLKSSKSLKDSLQHLENSSRKIADAHLHTPIRKKEVLPTSTQVNFSQDLDVLLSEVVRILK